MTTARTGTPQCAGGSDAGRGWRYVGDAQGWWPWHKGDVMADFLPAFERMLVNEGGYRLVKVAGDNGGLTLCRHQPQEPA